MRILRCDADHPALRRLHRACFHRTPEPTWADGAWWLVVDGAGREVGFAGVRQLRDNVWYLCRAGVIRRARGAGTQRRLIRVRERYARARGATALVTYTARWNVASANNLIRSGYELYQPPEEWGLPGSLYFFRRLGGR